MMVILIIVQLLRGSGLQPSLIGVSRCTTLDWSLYGLLILAGVSMTLYAICMQRKDYEYKKQIGYLFVPGDLKCTNKNAIILTLLGCLIGIISAITGLGAGVMINVILLRLDIHPRVAAETGQFMGLPIGWGAAICMLIYGQLRIDYAIVQGILTIVATHIGIQLQDLTVKRSGGKYQYQVLFMVITVILVCVSSASITALTINERNSQGLPIFRFESYCSIGDSN